MRVGFAVFIFTGRGGHAAWCSRKIFARLARVLLGIGEPELARGCESHRGWFSSKPARAGSRDLPMQARRLGSAWRPMVAYLTLAYGWRSRFGVHLEPSGLVWMAVWLLLYTNHRTRTGF